METFGKYQLVRRIGSGGMAEVFLARTTVAQGLNKQLVIKKIHTAYARSRQFVSMFVDEAKIALGLNHPNIVQVFDFGTVGDTFFLAMEYLEGLDLLKLMQLAAKKKERIPLALSAHIVQQVAKGLDYAHRKTDEFGEPLGIVHRDISPQNILVSYDGAVKIVDFGIARAASIEEEEGVVKGKFAYMAPEQARGERVDRRADVFSAGVVLFELCCARPLFPGKGKEVLDKVKAGAIPRPKDVNPTISAELEQTIVKALTFHRDDRFQTGRDLQHALARYQVDEAQRTKEIVDSATLAQFVARIVPPETRQKPRRPPTAPPAHAEPDETMDSDPGVAATVARAPIRERKYVFVLEGHVCGRHHLEQRLGKEGADAVVADFMKVSKDIAFKHQSFVHEVKGDDITLVVGLPVAGEDDASTVIRLANALVDALDGIGHDVDPELRLAVGVQRGVAVLRGRDGAKFEYELGQSTTAIAHRLAAEAHGADVLCGGSVYVVAKDDWNFERMATISIPADLDTHPEASADATQEATVYRLRGPKERRQRIRERERGDVDLIGRELQLKSLRDAYRDVLVHSTQRQVMVFGDAGLGKRALLSAFLAGVPKDEAVALRAVGRASTSLTPFGMLADLARDWMGLAEGAGAREVRRRLKLALKIIFPGQETSDDAIRLFDVACTILGVGNDDSVEMDAGERRELIKQTMVRIERQFAGDRPIIVIAEDVHWADSQSLQLFVDLVEVESSRGILSVLTSRRDDAVIKAAESTNADVVFLGELSPEDAAALVTRRFIPSEDVSELAGQIVSRTGGNPLFINEMIDSLEARGILTEEPAGSDHEGLLRWSQRDAALLIPTSVESLLATKIDRLPSDAKQTLMHAAVLGRDFTSKAVQELLARDPADDIAAITSGGLIDGDAGKYKFRNELTHSVTYQRVPEDERRALHKAIAERMMAAPRYQAASDDGVIGRHLELAGDSELAADRYLSAASYAIDVGGNSDAFRQLTRALKLIPSDDHERRFTARLQREEILRRLARRKAQLRELSALRKEAEELGDPAKLATAHGRLAEYYINQAQAAAASRSIDPMLEQARASSNKLLEAEALRLKSGVARLLGHNEEALTVSEQALALCGDDRDSLHQRALILNYRGHALWNMSRLREAIEAYAEALVIYRMLKLPRLESRALNNMGVVFSALGETEEALAHYKSSLKLDQRLGDRVGISFKLGNIGQAYADLGDLERGERYLRKAIQLAEQSQDRSTLVDVVTSMAQVDLMQQRFDAAEEGFERGLGLARDNRDRYQEIRATIYLAMTLLEKSRQADDAERADAAERALELAETATQWARDMPMPVGVYYGLAVQGLALVALDRGDEAVAATTKAATEQKDTEQPEGAEQIWAIHARVCEATGRTDTAIEAVKAAHGEARRKAARLSDAKLRQAYLASKVPRDIADRYRRLTGDDPPD